MFDYDNFIKRLGHLMASRNLSASAFSKAIGVQRSITSHVFSGRNKPSLDFILRILKVFPEVRFEWLILGEGDFLNSKPSPSPIDGYQQQKTIDFRSVSTTKNDKQIEKIIVLYCDKSFDTYR